MTQEHSIIDRVRKGDSEAFQALYQLHYRKLYSLCYRFTGRHEDAEEQLQEVFMRLLHKIDQFRGESGFATWAYRLATNHLLNAKRGKKHEEIPLSEMVENQGHNSDPDLAMILDKAVAQLADGFKSVFILHDREGFKHDEIGEILGISAATSRSQLSRARLALREKLKPLMTKERVA